MSKEIESLKRIETTFSMNKQGKESVYREYTNSIYPYYEDFDLVLNALQRLESIDNANPSEALRKLDDISYLVLNEIDDLKNKELWKSYFTTIKQALLKAQYYNSNNFKGSKEFKIEIPESSLMDYNPVKHYLKWEDLEFGKTSHKLKCKMNDSLYRIEWFIDGMGFKTVNIYLYVTKDYLEFCTACNEQFFNDLHLERVEDDEQGIRSIR